MSAAAVATATSSSTSSSSQLPISEPRTSNGKSNNVSSNSGNASGNLLDKNGPTTQQQQQQQHQSQQNQSQQHQELRNSAAAAVEPDVSNNSNRSSDPPLPADLRRILMEVARTGTCIWLYWNNNQDGKDQHHQPPETMAAAHPSALAGSAASKVPLGGIGASSGAAAQRKPSFSRHRRSTSSPYAAAVGVAAQVPPRKKHRNGLHKSTRRRFATTDGNAASGAGSGGGRKRPLFLIRTTANATASGNATATGATTTTTTATSTTTSNSILSAGSVGSGRTSGSEPDDSTQYECDSEGTSATTNSEVSVERRDHHLRMQQRVNANALHASKVGTAATIGEEDLVPSLQYKTLQEAFRVALGLVLDHFYRHRGGYKLSPAEKRRNATLSANLSNISSNSGSEKASNSEDRRQPPLSSESVYQQRRQRLLSMLLPCPEIVGKSSGAIWSRQRASSDGPPFTIQRIAEVLVAPERYYTQTHKLCNCLEKLLLVTSSTGAFGGSTGGDTSQSRREERELAALADEKGRQESELRQRRLRRRLSSPSDEIMMETGSDAGTRSAGLAAKDDVAGRLENRKVSSPEKKTAVYDGSNLEALTNSGGGVPSASEVTSREMLEAAARASLRTKFDHVGIDPHSSADVRSIAENRGLTNSPPPPSLAMAAAASNIALPGHTGVAGFVRQHLPEQNSDHPSIARVPSPILFSPGTDSPMHATTNMHMLQLHHAAALAGVSMGGTPSPLDLVTIDSGSGAATRTQGTLSGGAAPTEGPDLEVEHGRSSASNSDVDSESDDVSLDDSASDRSDGSDSGSVTHYEPFTAARAMALNRMQQQQRLQSRALTSLSSLHQSEGFRPPADSEYQSGDSIDSMRAEDSGGSDSSSSDLAD